MRAYFFRSILPLLYSSVLTVAICLRVFAQDPALAPPEPPQWTVLEDADQDGLTDWDEFLLFLDPLNPLDGLSDADGDELWLAWEWYLGTHSDLADTDGDGWSDSLEVLLYGTDPLDPVSKPLGNGAEDHGDAAAALEPEQTPTPEEDLPPPPPPSLSNGDFTDIGIQTWKDQSTSKSYQGGGFQWGEGTASSWSAYFGKTIEVWQANGETFVELDGNTTSYGIKQPIANARAGAFILAWKQSGRNDTKSGTNPYYVRIYHESDKGPVVISDSKEFSGYDKLKWTDNIHVFQITPEQIAAANGKLIYAAFIPTSLNTYGTLIDKVAIHTMDLIAHKRGTIDKPGPAQPKGNGEYGYETVMMENADSENNDEGKRDCDEVSLLADQEKDNDFVKIVLHYNGPKIKGASLELKHEGIAVNAKVKASKMADPRTAVEALNSGSRLNFYDKDGILLNPATDLKISDLENPGTGYLARILDPANNGKLILFIEGADDFGSVGPTLAPVNGSQTEAVLTEAKSAQQKLGGSRLKLSFKKNEQIAESPVIVYRGGFLLFRQPINNPGVAGTLEFWDGKGRIRHDYGGHKNEFKEDETDFGEQLISWSAKSGLRSGEEYNLAEKNGHIPPGWWFNFERTDFKASHSNSETGSGNSKVIRQGAYCRWKQDDLPEDNDYVEDWVYKASNPSDKFIGEPVSIKFKYELLPLPPTSGQDRSAIQLHPDGKKNGTSGCIGIQQYDACSQILYVMRNYNNILIKAIRE